MAVITLFLAGTKGLRLDQRVRAQEMTVDELDLVVGIVREKPVGRREVDQMVTTLLEYDDRPARLGQNVRNGRSCRP